MPLTEKGKTIKRAMKKTYGKKKGEDVFYASEKKGTVKGVKKHDNPRPSRRKRLERKAAEGLKRAFPDRPTGVKLPRKLRRKARKAARQRAKGARRGY